jgi:hypothetical protein
VLNPVSVLTDGQIRLKLFGRAFMMSIANAGGIWLISHGSFYAGATGCFISWHWFGSVRDVGDHARRVRFARTSYAAGGGVGAILIVFLGRTHIL